MSFHICFLILMLVDVWYQKVCLMRPDVPQVIGLFPNLLPPDYQQKMVYSGKLPELEGNDLEKGLNALQGFLTCVS